MRKIERKRSGKNLLWSFLVLLSQCLWRAQLLMAEDIASCSGDTFLYQGSCVVSCPFGTYAASNNRNSQCPGYTNFDGTWILLSGIMTGDGDGKSVSSLPSFCNGSVYAEVFFPSPNAYNVGGLIVRVANAGIGIDNFQGYGASLSPSHQTLVFSRHNFGWLGLSNPSCSVPIAQWISLQVTLAGPLIQVYVNGTLQLSYTDSTLAFGAVGLRQVTGPAQYRNVQVKTSNSDTWIPLPFGSLCSASCYECPPGCGLCSNGSTCEMCMSGFYLFQKSCFRAQSCPKGTFPSKQTKQCSGCADLYCDSCLGIGNGTCTACKSGHTLTADGICKTKQWPAVHYPPSSCPGTQIGQATDARTVDLSQAAVLMDVGWTLGPFAGVVFQDVIHPANKTSALWIVAVAVGELRMVLLNVSIIDSFVFVCSSAVGVYGRNSSLLGGHSTLSLTSIQVNHAWKFAMQLNNTHSSTPGIAVSTLFSDCPVGCVMCVSSFLCSSCAADFKLTKGTCIPLCSALDKSSNNCTGVLPPGSYTSTCSGCMLFRNILECSCCKMTGSSCKRTSLSNITQCTGNLVNSGGTLLCYGCKNIGNPSVDLSFVDSSTNQIVVDTSHTFPTSGYLSSWTAYIKVAQLPISFQVWAPTSISTNWTLMVSQTFTPTSTGAQSFSASGALPVRNGWAVGFAYFNHEGVIAWTDGSGSAPVIFTMNPFEITVGSTAAFTWQELRKYSLSVNICPEISAPANLRATNKATESFWRSLPSLGVYFGLGVVVFLIGVIGYGWKKYNQKTEDCHFPFWVMEKAVFLRLKRIPTHEEAVRQSWILKLPPGSRDFVLFLSHRWLSQEHPDDQENKKLHGIEALLENPEMHVSYIWMDFFCIPQAPERQIERLAAINTLPYYVRQCFNFVILTGSSGVLVENETGENSYLNGLDRASMQIYESRGWCRLERFAAASPVIDSNLQRLPATRIWQYDMTTKQLVRAPFEKTKEFCMNPLEGSFRDGMDEKIAIAPMVLQLCAYIEKHSGLVLLKDRSEIIKVSAEKLLKQVGENNPTVY